MIGIIFAFIATLSWATGSLFDRKAVENITPFLANTLRAIPAAVFIFILMVFFEGFKYFLAISLLDMFLILIGTILAFIAGNYFFLFSLRKIGVSRTMPIAYSYPLFAILFSYIFLSETLIYISIIGEILIVLGIYIISRENKESQNNVRQKLYLLFIPILCSFFWGINQVLLKFVVFSAGPFTITFIRLIFFSTLLIITNLIRGNIQFYKSYLKIGGKMAIVGGILSFGLGGLFFILSINFMNLSIASPISALTPVISTILSIIFLKEKIKKYIIIGTSLTVIGVIVITIT